MPRMNEPTRPILTGHKALVVGSANDQSIAYGCAKAFRTAGAAAARRQREIALAQSAV